MYLYDKLINKIFTNINLFFSLSISFFFKSFYDILKGCEISDVTICNWQIRIFCNNMNNFSLTHIYIYSTKIIVIAFSPTKYRYLEVQKRNFTFKNHNFKKSYVE